MNKIDINKKYKTRSGLDVIIYSVTGGGDCPVHGAWWNNVGTYYFVDRWTEYGYNSSDNEESGYDLIEVGEYDHIKIDDPVLVWDYNNTLKIRGHFAGISKEGLPIVWYAGRTSHTVFDNKTTPYLHCQLYTDDK